MTGEWTPSSPFDLWGAVNYDVRTGEGEHDVWQVSVATPPAELAGPGPFPYLVIFDPIATFATTVGIAMTTAIQSLGALRPIGVVGIGPSTSDVARLMGQRMFDLTPTASTMDSPMPTPFGTGGGDAMLDMISDTVIPFVEEKHPLDPTDRGIGGWSLGGLMVCHALLTRRETFHRFLAVSPSLWWNGQEMLASPALASPELAGADVYLSVGQREAYGEASWPPLPPEMEAMRDQLPKIDMVSDMRSFADSLQARGDLEVAREVIADEHHNTVWAAAATRGIVRLYGAAR